MLVLALILVASVLAALAGAAGGAWLVRARVDALAVDALAVDSLTEKFEKASQRADEIEQKCLNGQVGLVEKIRVNALNLRNELGVLRERIDGVVLKLERQEQDELEEELRQQHPPLPIVQRIDLLTDRVEVLEGTLASTLGITLK